MNEWLNETYQWITNGEQHSFMPVYNASNFLFHFFIYNHLHLNSSASNSLRHPRHPKSPFPMSSDADLRRSTSRWRWSSKEQTSSRPNSLVDQRTEIRSHEPRVELLRRIHGIGRSSLEYNQIRIVAKILQVHPWVEMDLLSLLVISISARAQKYA